MFATDDTIAAIATPPGRGGIGIVRLSGPEAAAVARQRTGRETFAPRHATLTTFAHPDGSPIDQVVVTFFPAPHSYTGEDVVEVSAHGSPVVLTAILQSMMDAGARLAAPGEFTLRAYLHGRIDLVQAEAVGALIDAVTPLQARVAFDHLEGTLTGELRAFDAALLDVIVPLEASLDFPDEGYHFITAQATRDRLTAVAERLAVLLTASHRGRVIRDGLTVAIVGRPNVGKSSLFNRLAGAPRAIVTSIPGTTRDLLSETVDIHGIPFTLVDTAGVREHAADAVEEEGIGRARTAAAAADVVLLVLDAAQAISPDDDALLEATAATTRVITATKSDLPAAWDAHELAALPVSALTDHGIDALREALASAAGSEFFRDRPAIANARQSERLEHAQSSIRRAAANAAAAAPEECILADLHDARRVFDDVVGARPADEVLHAIFDRFCIGK